MSKRQTKGQRQRLAIFLATATTSTAIYQANREHKTLEPLQICSPYTNLIEQLLGINSKLNNTSPLIKIPEAEFNCGEITGRGPIYKCNSSRGKTKPHRTATSKQPEVPAGTAIAERGHRRVPGLGGAQEDGPAVNLINQALVPGVRPTQGGNRENSNNHRFATIEFPLCSTTKNSTPKIGKPWEIACL